MRPVTEDDTVDSLLRDGVSISYEDRNDGSPRIGDHIARNPANHRDKWLVASVYFSENFTPKDY